MMTARRDAAVAARAVIPSTLAISLPLALGD